MTVHWDKSNCDDWDNTISADHLAAAMFGYRAFESTVTVVTEENYEDIAKYIFEQCPLQRLGSDATQHNTSVVSYVLSLEEHVKTLKQAIGFVRRYIG